MTNKLKYFIGNWKMFGVLSSYKIIEKINKFHNQRKKFINAKIVLCVPNTIISCFNSKLKQKSILLGAQNCHYSQNFGPFTGSVNAPMLKNAGAKYVIIGHSENRALGETNSVIKKKIDSALRNNLKVIFCIGETLKQRKKKVTFNTLKKQIRDSVKRSNKLSNIIIAYEPIWSIGTNKILDNYELKKIIKYIKKEYKKYFNTSKHPIVLYGGSVNQKNIESLSSIEEIDGFLIGGASQSAKKFIDIIKNYYK